jgi:epoxyqueuosine reductase QueG
MGEVESNTLRIRELFQKASSNVDLRGILGVTPFRGVYDSLMDVQKQWVKGIAGSMFVKFLESGNIISFAFVYPEGVIDNIGLMRDGVFDKEAWNIYAGWYTYLNNSLDKASSMIAEDIKGEAISATTTGLASKLTHVSQYFPRVVSHRVHAERAGIGWRGKNSLIVNPRYSCMIRLSGVITDTPIVQTPSMKEGCGDCTSCEDACTFLKHRDRLDDYREQCRVYLDKLGLDDEVCGKCIKACVYSPRLANPPEINREQPLNMVYYTNP